MKNGDSRPTGNQDQSSEIKSRFSPKSVGYWEWNLADNTQYLSPDFREMFGYSEDELSDSPNEWQKIVHPEDLPGFLENFNAHIRSKGKKPHSAETRFFHKDGSIIWLWSRGSVVKWDENHRAALMVGSFFDITELKEREARIEQEMEAIRHFTFIAAHDLREPLTTTENYSSMLQKHLAGSADDLTTRLVETIRSSNLRMRRLVRGILEFSSLFNDTAEFEDVDMSNMFSEALDFVHDTAQKKGAEITIDPLPIVSGKPALLTQVALNLLSNSLKYSQEAVPPRIHVSAYETATEHVIVVTDNGIGIEPKFREKVFEMFSRLHAMHEYDGIGLGLAACRRILILHGGRIWIEDPETKGTRFKIALKKTPEKEPIE